MPLPGEPGRCTSVSFFTCCVTSLHSTRKRHRYSHIRRCRQRRCAVLARSMLPTESAPRGAPLLHTGTAFHDAVEQRCEVEMVYYRRSIGLRERGKTASSMRVGLSGSGTSVPGTLRSRRSAPAPARRARPRRRGIRRQTRRHRPQSLLPRATALSGKWFFARFYLANTIPIIGPIRLRNLNSFICKS
jgi:hypothetical protein